MASSFRPQVGFADSKPGPDSCRVTGKPEVGVPVADYFRVASSTFASLRCGEMLDTALRPVAFAIGFHRVNRVVIRCPRLEAVHAHAENRVRMARIQPDWGLRGLA